MLGVEKPNAPLSLYLASKSGGIVCKLVKFTDY